jgi:hypothetical protein
VKDTGLHLLVIDSQEIVYGDLVCSMTLMYLVEAININLCVFVDMTVIIA